MSRYIIGAIVIFIFLILILIIKTYNTLIKLRNNVKDQWSQIDVQLKRRAELIPNLVEIVKGYAKHESDTLEKVINARNNAISAQTSTAEIKANKELSNEVSKVFALAEAYPELKANTNFISLQNSLNEIEEKIAYSRQFYNDTILKLNNKIESFPTILIARLLGFKKENFLEATAEEKVNVKINFNK